MRSILAAALALTIVGLPLAAQDKKQQESKKDDTPKVDDSKMKPKELIKAVADDLNEFRKEKSNQQALIKKVNECFDRLLKAVEANPKAEGATDLVIAALQYVTSRDGIDKLKKVVVENDDLLKGDKPYRLIMLMGSNDPEFLDKVLKVNKAKEVTALVNFMKAKDAVGKFSNGEKAADKEAALKYAALVPADMVLDVGPQKINIGAEAAKFPKKIDAIERLGVGKQMTDLVSKDLDGKVVKLSDYKDKVVVLDIWATWCPPCRAMIPHEREMAEKFKEKPFALISLSADEKVETLKQFLEKEKMPWTHWHIGAQGDVHDQLNIEHYPTIFVLDSKGKIRYKEIRGDALEKAVETLLKEVEVR